MYKYAVIYHYSKCNMYIKRYIYAESDRLALETAHDILMEFISLSINVDPCFDMIKLTE